MITDEVSQKREASSHDERFVHDLLALNEAHQTGVLTVRVQAITIDIYLRDGTPVFAERDTLGGSLGRVLLKNGVISENQYESIISQMTQELFESEQMRFAEVAVQLGFLTHEEVNLHLEQQVKKTVVECIAYREPEVTFRADEAALARVANYPCPVPAMVMSGVKAYYDLARAEAVWRPDALAYAELRAPASEVAELYALQPKERRYIGSIDGSRRIEEVVHTELLDVLPASQILAALLLTDGVRLFTRVKVAAKASAAVKQVELRPVQSESARRRMSSPVLRAARPEQTAPVAPPSAPARVSAQTDTSNRRIQAEKLFVQGRKLLKSESLPRALRSFAAAARLQPDSAEYQLCEKWTEFLLRPPASADETLLLLDKLALSTLRQDKRNAFAYYVHGRVAHAQGDSESAKSALKIAIKLDPSNFEAKTFLHALLRR